jgi:hypothetical protein
VENWDLTLLTRSWQQQQPSTILYFEVNLLVLRSTNSLALKYIPEQNHATSLVLKYYKLVGSTRRLAFFLLELLPDDAYHFSLFCGDAQERIFDFFGIMSLLPPPCWMPNRTISFLDIDFSLAQDSKINVGVLAGTKDRHSFFSYHHHIIIIIEHTQNKRLAFFLLSSSLSHNMFERMSRCFG